MRTVVGIFNSKSSAETAVGQLRDIGFDREISIVTASENHSSDYEKGNSLSSGAATGGVVGGIAGLALGASAIAIPGIGPLLAAGPISALLTGAATGGLIGGLGSWGVTGAEGRKYEDALRDGKILAFVHTDNDKVDEAAQTMRTSGAESVTQHNSR